MMNIEAIRDMLPHRYPFLLVDRVTNVDLDNKTITCIKNVTINEPFFNGHFPNHAIMPGVLIIEAMAQAAGLLGHHLVSSTSNDHNIYYFAGADKVRFRRPVTPGDQVCMQAQCVSCKRDIWKFDCTALVNEKIICSAIITCASKESLS